MAMLDVLSITFPSISIYFGSRRSGMQKNSCKMNFDS